MAEQTSKTVIGGFVIGALTIAIVGVMVLGSGKIFEQTSKFIMYFGGSVKGLNIGSTVSFRGVKIGEVSGITLQIDTGSMLSEIPVMIEVQKDSFEMVGGAVNKNQVKNIQKLIDAGLRGQLASQSLVTGQLMIELDYHPDKPAKLVGKQTKYLEIPTVDSTLESITKTIESLHIENMITNVTDTLNTINKLVDSPAIPNILNSIQKGTEEAHSLIENLNAQVKPVTASVKEAVEDFGNLAKNTDKQLTPLMSNAKTAIEDYDKLARNIDGYVSPIAEMLESATSVLKVAEEAIKSIEEMVAPDSIMSNEFKNTLQELSSASRAIRVWADYLERHPEALIQGKGGYGR